MNNKEISATKSQGTSSLLNLSHYLGKRGLAGLALDAVQKLDWGNPGLISKSTLNFQPRMMLTLLGYCYASNRYGSREIQQAILSDPMVRYLCAREYPDEESIRRFRKENRPIVLQCLHYILTQCWASKLDQAEVEFISYEWFETVLSSKLRQEAHDRLEIASFIDLMESEL